MNTINRKHHSLKTDPIPFGETMQGRKLWEIRLNDRDFCEGDTVTLHETASSGREMAAGADLEYTGRSWNGMIAWILHGPQYGLAEGWCIFGVVPGFADTAEDIEARLQYERENSCPHCGGSGHKDDCATDAEPVAWVSPLVYGQQVTFYKPTKPECSESDELGQEWYCRPLVYADTHPPAVSQGVSEDEYEHLHETIRLLTKQLVKAEQSTSPGNGWVKDSEKFDVRGFEGLRWKDRYDHSFSIQKSSLATEDCIWFGLDDADPKVLHGDARRLGVDTDATCGWVKYPIPDEVSLNTRMHLTREQVAGLLPLLQHFAETGDLPETPTTGESK